jgi:orotate phosphoribosyltransferase
VRKIEKCMAVFCILNVTHRKIDQNLASVLLVAAATASNWLEPLGTAPRPNYTGPVTRQEILDVFRETGALLEGHFVLRSGMHSRQYFQCALALQQMPTVEKLGGALASQVRHLGAGTVVSPAMGGLVLGQEVARQLGVRFIFVEKEEGKLALRRGFKIAKSEKILVVEDVVTKGGRVQETLDIVRAHGGDVVGVAMAVDRSNGAVKFGVPSFSLLALEVEAFEPDKLPADLAALPAVKPGSK